MNRRQNEPDRASRRTQEERHMERRQALVSGALLASLLTLAAPSYGQPDCSQPVPPPTGSIAVTGPQVRVGEHLFAGPGASVKVTTDAVCAPTQWTPVMDGQEASAWPTTWTAGEHTVAAAAVDTCGRRTTLAPVAFTMDTAPPTIGWETGDRQSFRTRLAPDTEHERRRIRWARTEGRPPKDTWISVAGVLQTPLPWVDFPSKTFLARAVYPVQVKSDHPQAFLAAPGTVAAVDGTEAALGERLLWITAEDAGAGVESMTLRLQNEQNRAVLVVEAVDQVGNSSRKEIVLRRGAAQTSR
jgi:hypothetical protein